MNLKIAGFILLAMVQIAVPFQMIMEKEIVLSKGTLFRFRTEPIDPVDPFQGRYVQLRIEEDYVPLQQEIASSINYKSSGYVSISTGEDGFAHFNSWSDEKPAQTNNYLRTRVLGEAYEWRTIADGERKRFCKGIRIEIPFTRFYMDEAKAPRAEQIARDALLEKDCWVEVRILKGRAVIEDVLIEGQSLRDLAAAEK